MNVGGVKVSCADGDEPLFAFSAKASDASVSTLGGIVTDGI